MNPVVCLWVWLKLHALVNGCPYALGQSHINARNKLKRGQRHPSITTTLLVASYAAVM
ncbi:MAG: hypothetical protein ING75_09360 [Rhodocyclaceae bacterium]|nr:hypothetical protein [Rhodocyclaceae bacterium]